MTELTITPKVSDKTARFKGTIAAGEHVAVTINGGAEWIGTDNGANLTLRVLDLVTGRTLAVFPRPEEALEEDEDADAWAPATDDANDLYCELNLNTTRMVAAARHMLRVPVMFVLGDTDDPRTLYFRDRYEVEYWPERIGDTTPYDLDKWPKKIDDWTELVTGWTAKLNGMKLTAVPFTGKVVSGVSKNGVTITLNDGDDTTDTVVDLFDGEVSAAQMNAAISAMGATKQNALTFDAIPTAESDNPVKSRGVKAAIDEVADGVTEHVGNTGIHVTATQKTAWTAKYDKPQGGIPKSDLAQAVKDSLGKADTAVQAHQDLSEYVNGAVYDSNAKSIKFKHDTTVLFEIDATAFIKDGMVDSVEISGGNLVISFNTDAGIEDIEIPLTNIFNPANYYDKTAADGRFVQKEAGKGLVAVDATLTTSDAAADAKAVGDALRGGFTEWVCDEISDGWTFVSCEWDTVSEIGTGWFASLSNGLISISAFLGGNADSVSLEKEAQGNNPGVELSRHLITPTKTSQLTNDGAPNGGGTPYATTAQVAAKQDALTAQQLANIAAVPDKADKAVPSAAGNLAALNAQGNLADSGVKPSDFATPSDLPYALVTPGEWAFSGVSAEDNPSLIFEDGCWILYVDGVSFSSGNTSISALSVDIDTGGMFGIVTAMRASLPGHLFDRAVNAVSVTGETTLTLPAAVPGYARDFLVRLEISGSTVPTITFAAPTGETLTYETDGTDFPVPDEAGVWLYSFTETDDGIFDVSLKKANIVAQGGGT